MKRIAFVAIAVFAYHVSLHAHRHHDHVVVVEQVHPTTVIVAEQHPTTVIVANDNPIVVTEAPPALLVEEITPSPGANYVCIPGYWSWENRWVWKKHKWELKPQPYAAWEPGHWRWAHHHQGWVWSPGRWR